MERHKRMARTLGCLVASMTLGAGILEWLQPNRSSPHLSGTELIGQVARPRDPALPAEAGSSRWHSIYIDAHPADAAAGASRPHFVVAPDGRFDATNWRDQVRFDPDGVVRIGLVQNPNSSQMTAAQWSAAWKLIKALQMEWSIPRERVAWHDSLAAPVPEPAPQSGRPAPSSSPAAARR